MINFDDVGLDDWNLAAAYSAAENKELFIAELRKQAAKENPDYSVDCWLEFYNKLTPEKLAKVLNWQRENCHRGNNSIFEVLK